MINATIYNKVLDVCFPKLSDDVKEATYWALCGVKVSELVKKHGVSKNTIYKTKAKYLVKYALICDIAEEDRKIQKAKAITIEHAKQHELFMEEEDIKYEDGLIRKQVELNIHNARPASHAK